MIQKPIKIPSFFCPSCETEFKQSDMVFPSICPSCNATIDMLLQKVKSISSEREFGIASKTYNLLMGHFTIYDYEDIKNE